MEKEIRSKPIQSSLILLGRVSFKSLINSKDIQRNFALLKIFQIRTNSSKQEWTLVLYKNMIKKYYDQIKEGDDIYVETMITPAKSNNQTSKTYTNCVIVVKRIEILNKEVNNERN